MEQPNEKIVDLIRKLLALSKSPNENEASLALEKAHELLLKYNLDWAQISIDQPQSSVSMFDFPVPLGRFEWKRKLMRRLALNNFCETLIDKDIYHILGRTPNVLATVEMGSWIILQIDNMASLETYIYDGKLSKLRFRNSWLWGCTDRVLERLHTYYNQFSNNPNTKALVINLSKEVQLYMKQLYPNIHTHLSPQHYASSEAYDQGKMAGDSISFQHTGRQIESNGG